MNKKQSMKHLMIFAAGIIICSTMVLTSCSDDNPEHVVTWKTFMMELTPYTEIEPYIQKWDDDLMALQAMDLESYKQAACDIFLKLTVSMPLAK